MPHQPAELETRFGTDPVPLLLSAALVAGLLVQLLLPPVAVSLPRAPERPIRLHRVSPPRAAPASPPAAADQALALARPLFSSNRSGAAATPATGDTLTLLGIATAGRRVVATLRDGSGAIVSLTPGAAFDGWTLAGATRDAATLRRADVIRTLQVGQTSAGPEANAATAPE